MNKKTIFRHFLMLLALLLCSARASAQEAYACYTSGNTTLTFYYDNQRSSRPGTTYYLNTGTASPGWTMDGTSANVTKVVFHSSFAGARPTITDFWFSDMENLQSITGISYLNTSNVTSMAAMFQNCKTLTSLDVSGFNTSNVTNMVGMFSLCQALTSLDLSSFDTHNVINMSLMFQNNFALKTIYVGNGWSTESVENSDEMFWNCINLVGCQGTVYDKDHIDKEYAHIDDYYNNPGYLSNPGAPAPPEAYACYTSSNTTLTFYFDNQRASRAGTICSLPRGDNTPYWPKSSVTKVVFDSSFAGARPTTTRLWFHGMENLQSIMGISNLNTSKVTDMRGMFGCQALTTLDVSGFDTQNVTTMEGMFGGCKSLTSLDVSGFDTHNVTDMSYMFTTCNELTSLDLSGFDTHNVTDINSMFLYCEKLTSLDLSGFNTANVTSMHYMFAFCEKLTSLDLSSFNTSKVTDMSDMFRTCYSLTSCNLSNFNTSSVTDMRRMFEQCENLTSLDVSNFNTHNVTDMSEMFDDCYSLTSIDLSNFNTSKVTDMRRMFDGCKSLTSLDLSSFNTSKVTDMREMFMRCSSLTSCDLSSFNTSNVTDMRGMFELCNNLTTIYVGDGWSTAAVTESDYMFYYCKSLVGGQGTRYNDSNPNDKTYAHVDGGTSNPGYFTDNPHVTLAYACYTPSNTTLTFYYDNLRVFRQGTIYLLNTGTAAPGWTTDGTNANVTRVLFHSSFAQVLPTTTCQWFYDMQNLTEISDIANLNTSEVTNMKLMFGGCSSLTSLDLRSFNTTNVTDMSQMFQSCSGLAHLDLSSFNTAKVTKMNDMFINCTSLPVLDLECFNTSKVTDMRFMFYNCSNLATIMAGSGWTTAAVTTSNAMFYSCQKLQGGQGTTYNSSNPQDKTYAHIDGGMSNPGYLTDKGTPYVTISGDGSTLTFYCDGKRQLHTEQIYTLNNLSNDEPDWWYYNRSTITTAVFDPSFAAARPTSTTAWFGGMEQLTAITGIQYLNTSEVVHMIDMFSGLPQLTSIDVSHFDTRKVKKMSRMFSGSKFKVLDLTSFNTANVTDMEEMFRNSTKLTTVAVGDGWSTQNVQKDDNMFLGCTSIIGGRGTTYDEGCVQSDYAHVDGGEDAPGYFVDADYLYGPYAILLFHGTRLVFYSDGLRVNKRTSYTTYSLNWPADEEPYWYQDGDYSGITQVDFHSTFATARPTSTRQWFLEMENLTTITGIEYLNTSEVTDMADMFAGCCSLTSLDVSRFDTRNVTNMSYMFSGCSELTSLDVSGFDTRNVTDMGGMFANCSGLTSLDLSDFDTRKVTNMRNMFSNCEALTNLDLSSFYTARVTNMQEMFSYCNNLDNLDLTSFNTSNVTNMYAMFQYCRGLATIYVGNGWSTANVTSSKNMFRNCTNLVGGRGTAYDANHVDKEYARIDGGTSNPGYFSALLGDVNLDGVVNAADIAALANIIIGNPPAVYSRDAADLNGDNNVSIQDLTRLIRMLLP